jgi:hypothetical protein
MDSLAVYSSDEELLVRSSQPKTGGSIDDLQRLLGSLDATKKRGGGRKGSGGPAAVRGKKRPVKMEPVASRLDLPAPAVVISTPPVMVVPKRAGRKPKMSGSGSGSGSGLLRLLQSKQKGSDEPLSEAKILRLVRASGGLSADSVTDLAGYLSAAKVSGAVLSAALASMGADIPEADLEAVIKLLNKIVAKDTCAGFARHFWAGENLAPFLANVAAWKPSHEKLVVDFALRGAKRPDVYTAVLEALVKNSKLNAPVTLQSLTALSAATRALTAAKKSGH